MYFIVLQKGFLLVLVDLGISRLIAEVQREFIHTKYTTVMDDDTLFQRYIASMFLADMVFRELESEKATTYVNSQIVATIMSEFFSNKATLKSAVFF